VGRQYCPHSRRQRPGSIQDGATAGAPSPSTARIEISQWRNCHGGFEGGRDDATWRLTAPDCPQRRVRLLIWLSMIHDALISGELYSLLECGDGGIESGSTPKYRRRRTTVGNGALDSARIDEATEAARATLDFEDRTVRWT
jgi:hypothetical protein